MRPPPPRVLPARPVLAWLAMLLATLTAGAAAAQHFGQIREPIAGPPQSIGQTNAGCLVGGEALPWDGTGYQAVKLNRHRYFGHPVLIDYIQSLGARADAAGLGLIMVSDLGQAAGGPMRGSSHRSHQSGLDVDIWLRLGAPRLPTGGREGVSSTLVVDRANWVVNANWTPQHATLLRLAASDPRVARIFVHPAIKRALCQTAGNERDWLNRIRPWPGHDSHFHVRLNCPADSPDCVPQDPQPPGDGCGAELDSWFPDPNRVDAPLPPYQPPPMPAQCQAVLDAAF